MKAFVVMCLLAAAYARPNELLRPSFVEEQEANIQDIIRPAAIPQPPQIVQLPADVAPLVQIIVNIESKNGPEHHNELPLDGDAPNVGTFPLLPEGGAVGTFPLLPEGEPVDAPIVGTFPLLPPESEVAVPVPDGEGAVAVPDVDWAVPVPDVEGAAPIPDIPIPVPAVPIPEYDGPGRETFPMQEGHEIEMIQPGTIF